MRLAKTLLQATTMIAALAGSAVVAHAAPMLYAEASNNTTGQMIALSQGTSTTGNLSASGSAGGATVNVASQGLPNNAGLATITLNASATAGTTLNIIVTQTGLTASQASIPFSLTFTGNSLTAGSTAALTFADYISPGTAAAPNGPVFDTSSADLIKMVSLTATGSTSEVDTSGTASNLTAGGFYSETQFIAITFNQAGSISASSQLLPVTAVPEPASMALLGAGLFGLGMVRRRRSKQG